MKHLMYFLFLPISIYLSPLVLYSQEYAAITYHPRLMAQLTANQGVRETSIRGFQNSFGKQRELYEDAKGKMSQVMLIHEHIYQQLYNVNSLFKQSKQVKYIVEYIPKIAENASKMLALGRDNPQYAIWLEKYYTHLIEKSISLKDELQNLLKADRKTLMDAYDRDLLLDRVYTKLQNLNFAILDITNMLKFSKERAYIYSIPVLGTYVQKDKDLIENIMQKYRIYKIMK